MSTYRVQLPEDVADFLVGGNEAGPGPLADLADHVRPGAEHGQPSWTYLDQTAVRALRDLPEHYDGVISQDRVSGDLVMSVEGTGYVVEYVSERTMTTNFISRDPDEAIDSAFAADPRHGPAGPGEFDPWKIETIPPTQEDTTMTDETMADQEAAPTRFTTAADAKNDHPHRD